MITLPMYYPEGASQVIYRYYGKFMMDLVDRNRLNGLYGLTGIMLAEALREQGATVGDDQLIFDSEHHKTMFILRWS